MTDLERLKKFGDPLERVIIEHAGEALAGILGPYSQVWARFVLPHRAPGGAFIDGGWQDFASNNYTALIRVYNAHSELKKIGRLCSGVADDIGLLTLELQASVSSFSWFLGCAADNLGKTLERFPGRTLKGQDAGRAHISAGNDEIGHLYDRRTTLIHSRLIPIGIIQGCPAIDQRYLDVTVSTTITGWNPKFTSINEINNIYEEEWRKASIALRTAWMKVVHYVIRNATEDKKGTVSWNGMPCLLTAASATPPQPPDVGSF